MSPSEELDLLMPAPAEPLEVPTFEDWQRCERELTAVPDDYRSFVEAYGTGVIDDFIWLVNPISANKYLNLVSQSRIILDALEETSTKFPGMYPMPRFPDPGGLLPFAGTDNGDSLFWVTNGKPNSWTVAVMGPRSPECYCYDCGMLEFVLALLRTELNCAAFPSDVPGTPPLLFHATLG